MATITEDYVSYEVAKLLKEKGFDEKVNTHYLVHPSGFSEFFDKKDEFLEPEDVWLKCPTHQMAMKWLREVHGLSVETFSIKGTSNICPVFWKGNVVKLLIQDRVFSGELVGSYKEAVEAALNYCLKNLI